MSVYSDGWLLRFLEIKSQPNDIKEYLEAETKLLLEYIKPNSRLVDFGCGFGRHLKLIRDRLTYGLGMDIVPQYIDMGNQEKHPNLELIVADVTNINLNQMCDYAICMNNTLGNIDEKEKVIYNMRNSVIPGGIVLVSVHNENSIQSKIEWYRKTGLVVKEVTEEYILTTNGFKSDHFSKQRIRKLFGGCRIEEIEKIGYLIITSSIHI